MSYFCRIEAFEAILGQHVLANHLDQISIDEIEQTVNREAAAPYNRRQVEFILEVQTRTGYAFSIVPKLTMRCHLFLVQLYLVSFPCFFRGCKMQTG